MADEPERSHIAPFNNKIAVLPKNAQYTVRVVDDGNWFWCGVVEGSCAALEGVDVAAFSRGAVQNLFPGTAPGSAVPVPTCFCNKGCDALVVAAAGPACLSDFADFTCRRGLP